MFSATNLIKEWRTAFNLPTPTEYTKLSNDRLDFAFDLIEEECGELKFDVALRDWPKIVEETVDLIWVCHQLLLEMGVDVDQAVHIKYTSNMSKIVDTNDAILPDSQYYEQLPNGKFIIRDKTTGKVKKPDSYIKADYSQFK